MVVMMMLLTADFGSVKLYKSNKLLTAADCRQLKCKLKCSSPPNSLVQFIELGQRDVVVSSFELFVVLQLIYFMALRPHQLVPH